MNKYRMKADYFLFVKDSEIIIHKSEIFWAHPPLAGLKVRPPADRALRCKSSFRYAPLWAFRSNPLRWGQTSVHSTTGASPINHPTYLTVFYFGKKAISHTQSVTSHPQNVNSYTQSFI